MEYKVKNDYLVMWIVWAAFIALALLLVNPSEPDIHRPIDPTNCKAGNDMGC